MVCGRGDPQRPIPSDTIVSVLRVLRHPRPIRLQRQYTTRELHLQCHHATSGRHLPLRHMTSELHLLHPQCINSGRLLQRLTMHTAPLLPVTLIIPTELPPLDQRTHSEHRLPRHPTCHIAPRNPNPSTGSLRSVANPHRRLHHIAHPGMVQMHHMTTSFTVASPGKIPTCRITTSTTSNLRGTIHPGRHPRVPHRLVVVKA